MEASEVYIRKRSGTHADTLLAIGLASLLGDVFTPEQIVIGDAGDSFKIRVSDADEPVLQRLRSRLRRTSGFRFVAEKGEAAPLGAAVCHYEVEREHAQQFRQLMEGLRKAGRTSTEIREILQSQPDLRPTAAWRRDQAVRLLQGHLSSNKLVRQIFDTDLSVLREQVASGLERLANDAPSGFPLKADQVQVFNPPAAKGYARLKPDSTDRNDGTGDAWCDSLAEWLRVRGFHWVAAPFYTGSKGEHIRLITPIPADIDLFALGAVADALQRSGVGGSEPKLDVLAALNLARLLVEHCKENPAAATTDGPSWLSLNGKNPAAVISGIHVTHYQSLGQSRAVGSLHRVAVPGWFDIDEPQHARDWLNVLDEHRKAVRCLDDKRSDEIGILLAYRRFLQSPEAEGAEAVVLAFLEFQGLYACFLMRAYANGRYAHPFEMRNLRRVIVGIADSYTEILDDAGFQSIAAAVRRSTVNALAQKALAQKGQGSKDYREIRYDLLPDLRRKKSLSPDEFMTAVSEFVSFYNSENARRWEMGRRAPRNISTEEFRAFAELVERNGAEKIGGLLCAYGTCRESGEAASEADTPVDTADDLAADE